jgi:hypothetical protein
MLDESLAIEPYWILRRRNSRFSSYYYIGEHASCARPGRFYDDTRTIPWFRARNDCAVATGGASAYRDPFFGCKCNKYCHARTLPESSKPQEGFRL